MRIRSVTRVGSRAVAMAAAAAGLALAAGGCVEMSGEEELEGMELEEREGEITGGTVDLVGDGSVSGDLATCTSRNLGPGTIQSTDSWATGVALKNKWGSTIYYAWVSHNVSLAPNGAVSFAFNADSAYWRSPQVVSFFGPVGSLSGYRVDCIANAGVYFQSNPTETYVTPASIPESSYGNNVKMVKK